MACLTSAQTTFDILDPFQSTKRRAPRYSMGRRISSDLSGKADLPGPAAYAPPPRNNGPAFSMGMRTVGAPTMLEETRKRHTVGVLKLPALRDTPH